MKNVVYVCNYMLDDIFEERNNKSVFSQAGQNKMNLIYKSLKLNECNVKIISNGWMNNKTLKKYRGFNSKLNSDVFYLEIFDAPILNIVSSVYYGYRKIRKINYDKNIDSIIFYNFRPETAIMAYLAKKYLHIPIIVEYEDGYFNLSEISILKRFIINKVESTVKKYIDGAILVTSLLEKRVNTRSVIVRGISNQEIIDKAKNKKIKELNDVPIIMYSGGLEEVRGIRVLLGALKYTKSQFKLIITGRGECEADIVTNDDERIEFLGYIPYERVIEKMIDADILVNCQLEKDLFGRASFPSKIFEYSSTGNLIVSSNVSDICEFMPDIVSIYKDDNPRELAEKIDELLLVLNDENQFNIMREKIKKFNNENLPREIGRTINEKLLKRG